MKYTLGHEQKNEDVYNNITQELESQVELIITLNEDLFNENKKLRKLQSYKLQLETQVLEKIETIVILENKFKKLNDKVNETTRPAAYRGNMTCNFPVLHSTPIIVKRNITSKRALSSDKTSNLSFSLVSKGKKS